VIERSVIELVEISARISTSSITGCGSITGCRSITGRLD
jgi:hypothetical protein